VPDPVTDLLVLYQQEVPPPLSLELPGGPQFKVRQVMPPFPPLEGHLADLLQPLTAEERAIAGRARGGLNVRCDEGEDPARRLRSCVQIMQRCFEAGAVAILLPAACKVIGPTAMKALGPELALPNARPAYLRLFTHTFVFHDDQHAWTHTHGLELFGLPDFECRTPVKDLRVAQRLILAAIHFLFDRGDTSLNEGNVVEAEEEDGTFVGLAHVVASREVPGHWYGYWGALQLVHDPKVTAPTAPTQVTPGPGPRT
jgi:hypothetical protein